MVGETYDTLAAVCILMFIKISKECSYCAATEQLRLWGFTFGLYIKPLLKVIPHEKLVKPYQPLLCTDQYGSCCDVIESIKSLQWKLIGPNGKQKSEL